MTFSDYAVIGTADGRFAYGTGLLSAVDTLDDVFQYRLPGDVTPIIPPSGKLTVLRHPVVAEATRERFQIFVQIAAATDRGNRAGFVGIAVLIPWEEVSVSSAGAILHRLNALFVEATKRYVDENGKFTKHPGPLKSANREIAPNLKATDDGSRSVFAIEPQDLEGQLGARALHVLSSLEENARTVIQITTDQIAGFKKLTADVVSKMEDDLIEEDRLRQQVRERQKRQDEMTNLVARIAKLEAKVDTLEGYIARLRSEQRISHGSVSPVDESVRGFAEASVPMQYDDEPDASFAVGDPDLRRRNASLMGALAALGTWRILLLTGALLGSILIVLALAAFLLSDDNSFSSSPVPEDQRTIAQIEVIESPTCEDVQKVLLGSSLVGGNASDQLRELQSCARAGFAGLSPMQESCEDEMFQDVASALLGETFSSETALEGINELSELCGDTFE